jgi:hypothetical protein
MTSLEKKMNIKFHLSIYYQEMIILTPFAMGALKVFQHKVKP